MASKREHAPAKHQGPAPPALVQAELEILLWISPDEPLTRIGERLNLSVKTVSPYLARIPERMDMRTNADPTRYMVRHHLDR
jgi:two-component system, NarL family, invasion response regulator UvrY